MNKIDTRIIRYLRKKSTGKIWFPYSVELTSDGLDEWAAASTEFGLCSVKVRIRPGLDAPGTLDHEVMHVRQYQRLWILHNILYKYSKKYRLFSELQAFREQVRIRGYKNIQECAWIVEDLWKLYDTGYSKEQIREYASEMFADLLTDLTD